jgi:lipopolysaccharide/colanic/teichoic acid biosynthesis glycosyltransferase
MYRYVKRLLDIVFSVLGLLVGFPALVLIAAAGKINSKARLVQQKRIGMGKRYLTFTNQTCARMRRMTAPTHLLAQAGLYVTRMAGFWLDGLDELPQLVNILKGR